MFRNGPLFLSSIAAAFMLQGCSTFDPPAARLGVSEREARALAENYYWQRRFPMSTYSDDALDAVLAHSADPTLDGERAEGQASAVAVALTVVGDQRFAAALSRQSPTVRHAVSRDISYLWTHDQLHYPQTQALLQ